jgi:hypothetical protein
MPPAMPRAPAALIAAALIATAGCGSDQASSAPGREGLSDGSGTRAEPAKPRVRRAKCPADVPGCVAVTGRVLYVEAVDPDGDGDAHYVLAGGDVTARGISVVDVRRGLRPRRLPRLGDLVSAAGPVFTGRFGQRQIEATEVHHQRR